MRDIKQLFECPTGIDTGFKFSSLGRACFGDRRCVGILSFLGIERIRSLLKDTLLGTIGNRVAVRLCPFNCVAVMVAVYLELCTRGCEVRVHFRRSEDG